MGAKLKYLRISRGLKQQDIAAILNTHRGTISKYENNHRQPDTNTLIKLANYFEVSLDWLIGNSVVNKPDEYSLKSLDKVSEIYLRLPLNDQETLLTFAEFLLARQNNRL